MALQHTQAPLAFCPEESPWIRTVTLQGSCLRPCPAHGARSTHSLDAAAQGDSSARMLPSFASWKTLVVHALAAEWDEPGAGSVTVVTRLPGLRKAKTSVSAGRHALTPVPSTTQKSHPPPVFLCNTSLRPTQ